MNMEAMCSPNNPAYLQRLESQNSFFIYTHIEPMFIKKYQIVMLLACYYKKCTS